MAIYFRSVSQEDVLCTLEAERAFGFSPLSIAPLFGSWTTKTQRRTHTAPSIGVACTKKEIASNETLTLEAIWFWAAWIMHKVTESGRNIALCNSHLYVFNRVFIKNSSSRRKVRILWMRLYVWIEKSHRLLHASWRILCSKRRILRSLIPNEHPNLKLKMLFARL